MRDSGCVNCRQDETKLRVVSQCWVARSLWGFFGRMYTLPRIASYPSRGTVARGAFARLSLVLGEFVLSKNRCYRERQERLLRIIFPLLERLHIAVTHNLWNIFLSFGGAGLPAEVVFSLTNIYQTQGSSRSLFLRTVTR